MSRKKKSTPSQKIKALQEYLEARKGFIYHLRGHLAEDLHLQEIDGDQFENAMDNLQREEMHIYEMLNIIDSDS